MKNEINKIFKNKLNSNIFLSLLKYIIFLSNINIFISSDCNYTHPIKNSDGQCIEGGCSETQFTAGTCIIGNDIIKIQWINKRIEYSANYINYATSVVTENGNLICGSSFYSSSTKKYYFGLKKNGRPYFLDNGEETCFSITDSDKVRNEGNLFGIKLNGTNDDKEYIIAIGNNVVYVEIYDFEDNNNIGIYKQLGSTFFGTGYNSFQRASIFKLKNSKEDYYIVSIIAQPPSSSTKSFYVMKLLFTSLNIDSYTAIVKYQKLDSSYISLSSCFQTDNDYIFCFYLDDESNYIAIVYDSNLNFIISKDIATATAHSVYDFYKCIHFIGETGAFLYYNSNKNIEIQFKKFINEDTENSEDIINYFTSKTSITIKNNGYKNITKNSDLIKIDEKKFCLVLTSLDGYEFNIFIVNNYVDEKIIIRHYNIKMYNLYLYKIPDDLKISLYNGLIALACTGRYNNGNMIASVIIFSYPNSTDFNLDITNNLLSLTKSIINFYEKCNIENNIFGYIFSGVKIIDISKGYKLLSADNNNEINVEDILYGNVSTLLDLTIGINVENTGRIIYANVLTEPDYDIFNQYSIEIITDYCNNGDSCEDESNYFRNNLYVGRNSYFDITIDSNYIKNNCEDINENCVACTVSSNKCIGCKYLYLTTESEGKYCLNEKESAEVDSTSIEQSDELDSSSIEEITNIIDSTSIDETTDILDGTVLPSEEDFESKEDSKNLLESSTSKEEIEEITYENSTNIIIDDNLDSTNSETTSFYNTDKISEYNKVNEQSDCKNEEILNNTCKGKVSLEQMDEIKVEILNKNYTKENIIIKTENIIVQLSKLEDQENEKEIVLSNLDLGECEEKLKKANNIPREESLIIYKADIKQEGFSSTYVLFEVYNPYNLEKLNVSVCNDVEISINVPVKMSRNIELLYESLSSSGYNLFNENDSFYNDICAKYTTVNGTDILLSDRQKDIYGISQNSNESYCQNGCEIKSYNSETKKAKCECSSQVFIESSIETESGFENQFNIKEINTMFFKSLSNSNFRILKCYKLILDLSNLKKNIGLFIMSNIFIIFIILIIIYFILGNNKIQKYLHFILQLINKKTIHKKNKSSTNVKRKLPAKIKSKKSSKKYFKKGKSNIEKVNIYSIHKKKKSKKKLPAPPKKLKHSFLNNNSSQLLKKDEENKLNNNLSNNQVHNNILFNVQFINKKGSKKRNINTPSNKILSRKINMKLNKNNEVQIESYVSEFNIDKKFNRRSSKKIKYKKENNINHDFDPKYFKLLNDYEINNLEYELALELDKRTYCQYYWSLIKQKQIIIFTFFLHNDYNLKTIKITLLLISFSLYFTLNGFFFRDKSMHKIYQDNGAYIFLDRIPYLIYSTCITTIINMILKKLSLSQKSILEIRQENEFQRASDKSKKIFFQLKITFLIFFLMSFLFFIFFWYFISCFCAVFENTQIILIKDTLISFSLSMIYPFGINIAPGIFRIPALRKKDKNKKFIYKLGQVISLI